jgi:hypothetical protein
MTVLTELQDQWDRRVHKDRKELPELMEAISLRVTQRLRILLVMTVIFILTLLLLLYMDQKIMVNGLTVYPSWVHKDHKDPLEMTELQDHKDLRDPLEMTELQDHKDHRDPLEMTELTELQDQWDRKELPELMEAISLRVTQRLRIQLVMTVISILTLLPLQFMAQKTMVNGLTVYPSWVHKDHKDPLEMTELQDHKDHRDPQEMTELQDHKGLQVMDFKTVQPLTK